METKLTKIGCPDCKSKDIIVHSRPDENSVDERTFFKCNSCGTLFYD